MNQLIGTRYRSYKDPFDRIIIAQAMADRMTIITKDGYIPQYEVKTVWD